MLLLCVLFGITGWRMAPSVSRQVQQLSNQLPAAYNHLKQEVEQRKLERLVPASMGNASQSGTSDQLLTGIKSVFSLTLDIFAGILVILFTGIYIAATPGLYIEGLVRLFPAARRERARAVVHRVIFTLRYWILGQFLSMLVVGILIGVGLHFLGIPLALSLGILAGLLDCSISRTFSATDSLLRFKLFVTRATFGGYTVRETAAENPRRCES